METVSTVFSFLYPASLLFIVILLAIYYNMTVKLKKTKSITILIGVSLVLYVITFFSNYDLQLFMIIWFLRDIVFLYIMLRLWKILMKYKIVTIIVLSVLSIGLVFFYIKYGKMPLAEESFSTYNFDDSAELLFDIKDQNKLADIKSLLDEYDAQILPAFPHIEEKDITELDDYYTIDIDDKKDIPNIITKLINSKLVDWIEFNEVYKLSPIEKEKLENEEKLSFSSSLLNDPLISELWGFKYMHFDEFNEELEKKKPVRKARIFILDTGIDSEHEDLDDNYVSLNKKYDKDSGKHGTHCAGIACAVSNNNKGIASLNVSGDYTSITSITVLPGGSGTQESVIDGIILAADNGADVISMSLGGFSSEKRQRAYNQAIEYASQQGAIVVVAAGNEGSNAKNYIPASCDNVITVSAVDEDLQKATFSNYVNDIQYKVAAPGVNIHSTVPFNEYESMNGTSMATPYVAGLIGIMKSFEPNLTTEDAYRILSSTGIDTEDTEKTGKFIQPLKALNEIKTKGLTHGTKRFFNKLVTIKPD
jgi:thermitase